MPVEPRNLLRLIWLGVIELFLFVIIAIAFIAIIAPAIYRSEWFEQRFPALRERLQQPNAFRAPPPATAPAVPEAADVPAESPTSQVDLPADQPMRGPAEAPAIPEPPTVATPPQILEPELPVAPEEPLPVVPAVPGEQPLPASEPVELEQDMPTSTAPATTTAAFPDHQADADTAAP